MVVFPSPAGVGLIAVTKINLAFFFLDWFCNHVGDNFALKCPNGLSALKGISNLVPISIIGSMFAFLAISISLLIYLPLRNLGSLINVVFKFFLILFTT